MITDQFGVQNDGGNDSFGSQKLRPMGLFCDGMVMQRGQCIPVWGRGTARRRITGCLGKCERVTYSSDDGSFYMEFPPMEKALGMVLTLDDGESRCEIHDIAVGDVFLISGQSNMQFTLADSPEDETLLETVYPVRAFRVNVQSFPGGAGDVSGYWAQPSDATHFSAVGYFFGARYSLEHDVPVGLIDTSIGGIGAESFASEAELKKIPVYAEKLMEYRQRLFERGVCDESVNGSEIVPRGALLRHIAEEMPEHLPEIPLEAENFTAPDFDDSSWLEQDLPDSWAVAGFPHPGIFLYRKNVTLPQHFLNKKLTVSLGACDCADECFLNGELIGATGSGDNFETWNALRKYEVPAEKNASRNIVLAIKVSSLCSVCTCGGMVGPEDEMFIECGNERIPLTGIWKMRMAVKSSKSPMENMMMAGAGEPKSYHLIYDNMIRPIAPFALAGVLYYQGEANSLSYTELYEALMGAVVKSWRQLWGRDDMPFVIMQLPGFQRCHDYTEASPWAQIRQAQFNASMKYCGHIPVILTDCGDVYNIHPPYKKIPGARAASVMGELLEGKKPMDASYILKIEQRDSRRAVLEFSPAKTELADVGEKSGLVAVMADNTSVPVAARKIDSFKLEVVLPEGNVVAIAYGWCENPGNGKLHTLDGMPVFPFKMQLQ